MQWFPGSVNTAVQICRKNGALLIVFIKTDDARGERMDELWKEVDATVLGVPIVALRLTSGDEASAQFAQIYPTPIVPASYLINNDGKPLEVITLLEEMDNDAFKTKVLNAAQNYNAGGAAPKPKPSATVVDEAHQMESSSSGADAGDSSTNAASFNVEDKVERARVLLEQKRKREAEEKEKEEKRNELERIAAGKAMLELQKKRHEQGLLEAAAERKKDKLEAEKEKERLRALIKADREDRQRKQGGPVAPTPEKATPKDEVLPQTPVPSDHCRLQVRFPDGSSLVNEFDSKDTIETVMQFVRESGRVDGAFSLSQVYPRRVFGDGDLKSTLLDLALTPSSSLLLIQNRSRQSALLSSSPLGSIQSIITLLLVSPLQYIFALVTGFFSSGSGNQQTTAAASKKDSAVASEREQHAPGTSTSSAPTTANAEMRRRNVGASNVRGMNTVAGDEDPEDKDKEASWNGNSTQFL